MHLPIEGLALAPEEGGLPVPDEVLQLLAEGLDLASLEGGLLDATAS